MGRLPSPNKKQSQLQKRKRKSKKKLLSTMMRKNGILPLEVADKLMTPPIQTQITEEITEAEVSVAEVAVAEVTEVIIRRMAKEEREEKVMKQNHTTATEENLMEKKDHIPEEMEKEVEETEVVAVEAEVAVADITKTAREDHMMAR